MRARVWAGAATIGLLASLFPALSQPAFANEPVGEAIRVQQDTTQTLPASHAPLDIGDRVFRNARLETQEYGSAEMRFLDGSVLTIGPRSDLVIDEFVYQGESGTGRAAIALGVGVLRAISGRLPSGQVSLSTPVASVGIRGTDFTLDTTIPGLLRAWVDDGTIVVVPNESGREFTFSAPAYTECTLNSCRSATQAGRPTMFPERTGIFGLPIGDGTRFPGDDPNGSEGDSPDDGEGGAPGGN